MDNKPLVSVIIPTHNRPALLHEAINSVLNQTLNDWEIIIVDDCSTPPVNTLDIQNAFGININIKYHPSPLGGAAAKNTGVDAAKGKYIAFLDDDDLYDPYFLENSIKTLEQHNSVKTLFMGVKWFGTKSEWAHNDYEKSMAKTLLAATGKAINESLIIFDEITLFSALLTSVPMAFQRPVTLKQNFLNVGYYKQNCLLWDCDWAIRASLKGPCGLFNEGLYMQRSADQGYSSKPNRRTDHQISNFEIKKQLLKEISRSDLKYLINQSTIQAGQALSWGYMQQKQNTEALKTILKTFRYGLTPLQLKFLFHITYNLLTKSALNRR